MSTSCGGCPSRVSDGGCCGDRSRGGLGAKAEVRWSEFRGTEVGEKHMNELKAAFEKDNPDITLTIVDFPLHRVPRQGPHPVQAQKLADVDDDPGGIGFSGVLPSWECWNPWTPGSPRSRRTSWTTSSRPSTRSGRENNTISLGGGLRGMFWNTEISRTRGSPAPKTWEEYVTIAKKVTNPAKKIYAATMALQIEPPTNLTYDIFPLIYQAGGDVIDEKTNKAVFQQPGGVKAIEYYVDLINIHKVAVPGFSPTARGRSAGALVPGHRHDVRGPWGIAIQQQMNPNLKFDIALLPKGVTTGTVVRGQITRSRPKPKTRRRPGS